MKKNMGKVDRVIRAIVGSAVITLGIVYNSWFGLIGIIPLGTALVGRCPAYLPFKINTCKTK